MTVRKQELGETAGNPAEKQPAADVQGRGEVGMDAEWRAEADEGDRSSGAGLSGPADPNAVRNVLVVDDEPFVRNALARDLRGRVNVLGAGDADEALARLGAEKFDLVIADQGLPARSGIDLLEQIRESWPRTRRVLITGARDFGVMQEAINRAGIEYFLPKPWEVGVLREMVEGFTRSGSQPSSPSAATNELEDGGGTVFADIIGESAAIRELLEMVALVASTESTVLVTGETGTGKELVGRAIHRASGRSERAFCAVNSAAFPETLLESELFGHRRGAFTGASSNKKGLFEQAHRGTVFLDELAEMPLSMQAKLLRFLQTGEIRPVGAETTRYVDVRLVTATNKDLEVEVAAGRFREDLFYRLAVIPLHIAPLRERASDIPLLANHFLQRICAKTGKKIDGIDRDAMNLLMSHPWPGNVRELENAIERDVALLSGGDRITVADLPQRVREFRRSVTSAGAESLQGLEKRHILETLDKVGWNRKRAAELLQISTTTLWRRLKEFGIDGAGSQAGAVSGLVRPQG